MSREESAHWPASHPAYGGVAVSSLDMRRVMQAAAARQRKLNPIGRWAFRWMVRVRVWQEKSRRWGRPGAQTAATRPVGHPGGETAKS